MPRFPGPIGGTVPVLSNASPISLQRGESVYIAGGLGASATQLPVTDGNVAFEDADGPSIAVVLQPSETNSRPMVSVEILMNGLPGAGESIAIQEADTHADGFFITPSNPAYTINSFNSNNAARVDLSPTGGKFLRINRTSGANDVSYTAKVTRYA